MSEPSQCCGQDGVLPSHRINELCWMSGIWQSKGVQNEKERAGSHKRNQSSCKKQTNQNNQNQNTQRAIFMKFCIIFSVSNMEGEAINSKYTLCYSLQKC